MVLTVLESTFKGPKGTQITLETIENVENPFFFENLFIYNMYTIDLWGCTGSDPHGIEILCMVGGGWVRAAMVPNFETAK